MREIPEELKPCFNPNSKADQLFRVNKLPEHIAEIGRMLLEVVDCMYSPTTFWRFPSLQCGVNEIGNLSADDRSSIFSAIFPGIASEVEVVYLYFDNLTKLTVGKSSVTDSDYRADCHIARKTRWLISFSKSIIGFENNNINWFIEHENRFTLGHFFSALIAEDEKSGDDILQKILQISPKKDNYYLTFLCTPLNIGEKYLQKSLDNFVKSRSDQFHFEVARSSSPAGVCICIQVPDRKRKRHCHCRRIY